MNVQAVTVEGTLQPDGTLQLDQKPNLSPGRVQVIVQPLPPPVPVRPQRGLVDVMDEIRASQLARGYHGRSPAEMKAEEAARQDENDEYERRCEDLWGSPLPPT
jgi:hypothetical protein